VELFHNSHGRQYGRLRDKTTSRLGCDTLLFPAFIDSEGGRMKRVILAIAVIIAVVFVSAGMLYAQAKKAPATITLTPKTKAMGPVTLNHATHSKQFPCTDCHAAATGGALKTAAAKPNAFHATGAKAGLCVDCHVKEAAAGKKVPTKCADGHKKAA
jgi:hypothetical protein